MLNNEITVEKVEVPKTLKRTSATKMDKEVLAMQEALSAIGFHPNTYKEKNGCDGKFDLYTEEAVLRFQKIYTPYEADGVYTQKTKEAIEKVVASMKG